MKIGLYFGSFNPIHIGHLIIANHAKHHTDLDQVWLVVSPQNPLKPSNSLLNEYHRLHLAKVACEDNDALKVSDIEFTMPKPSYTIDTLAYLQEKYPNHEFAVIMGSDSIQNITRWKNYKLLLKNHSIYVFKRPGYEYEKFDNSHIVEINAPLLDISSTMIRNFIKAKKPIKYLVSEQVEQEILNNSYYL